MLSRRNDGGEEEGEDLLMGGGTLCRGNLLDPGPGNRRPKLSDGPKLSNKTRCQINGPNL